MNLGLERNPTLKLYWLILAVVCTGIFIRFNMGISGNDFWWHVKIGEWIVDNHTVPTVGIYSWFAMNNNLEWISHEWLSEVVLYFIFHTFGSWGIFILSFLSCIVMLLFITLLNKQKIIESILPSMIYLLMSIIVLPTFFFGRPHIFSVYLLFLTLFCLYSFVRNQSKIIYFIPFISILWSNIHGGSSNMPYILCIIFIISGLFGLSYAHLESIKNTKHQTWTLILIAILSFLGTAINPHGLKMLIYPYINMFDKFMLSSISEWMSPDAKDIADLALCFFPILFVSLTLLLSNKKIKLLDLLLFLFFAYLAFRSMRFILLFYIASSFFVFDYLPIGKPQKEFSGLARIIIYSLYALLLAVILNSSFKIYDLSKSNELISVSLDDKYISMIKHDAPQRLYNDYNYSDLLIYNGIDTFADARADIFSKNNLVDAFTLMNLKLPGLTDDKPDEILLNKSILNIEALIAKYDFDAFLLETNRSLTSYLLSHPEKYLLKASDETTSYFVVI